MHARWDQHNHLDNELEAQCHDSRGISATLVHDLKDRGLSKGTLVTSGDESCRTLFFELYLNKVTR